MDRKLLLGNFLAAILLILVVLISVNAVNLRGIPLDIGKDFIHDQKDTMDAELVPYFSYDISECILEECNDCEDIDFVVDSNDLTYYHYSEQTYNCCATMTILLEMEESTIRFIEMEHFEEGCLPCPCPP